MSMDARDRFEQLIEKRTDGLMSASDREELERLAGEHSELRRALELEGRVDVRLRALFALPERAPALEATLGSNQINRWRHYASLAAIIVVATVMGVAAVMYVGLKRPMHTPGPAYALHTKMDAGVLYARIETRGFEPDWVCETESQFAAAVAADLGARIAMPFDDPQITILGWTHLRRVREGEEPAKRDLLLMTRDASGEEILVAMGRVEADPGRESSLDAALGDGPSVFRRELGGVVLYEITPFDAPRVIEKLRILNP